MQHTFVMSRVLWADMNPDVLKVKKSNLPGDVRFLPLVVRFRWRSWRVQRSELLVVRHFREGFGACSSGASRPCQSCVVSCSLSISWSLEWPLLARARPGGLAVRAARMAEADGPSSGGVTAAQRTYTHARVLLIFVPTYLF